MFSFLSIEFALLFIVFFVVYWSFKAKPHIQNGLLCLASYAIIYLMAGIMAVLALFIFSLLIIFIAKSMEKSNHKKFWLFLGIFLILTNLGFFKYYDFFRDSISYMMQLYQLDTSNLIANIVFPLGISYYSFQAVSYLVTVYRQEMTVPKLTILQTITYFSFFATITAGPITRINDSKGLYDVFGNPCGMSPQLTTHNPRKILLPTLAFALILLALVKKWWLAGYLADNWVNPVFDNPTGFHSLEVLMAIYGYTLQLFLDFSGYSEMMVGFGLLLGFRLPMNFNAPLLAHNIRDFWDRWHISLSTWIRDYIYIPLGGSRVGFVRTQANLLAAMVFSGIWHGSTINFFFWGLLHGLAIILLNIGDKTCQKLSKNHKGRDFLARTGIFGKILGVFVTVHFVALAFVFFRAKTTQESLLIFEALFYNNINIPWVNNPLYLLSILLISWLVYPIVKNNTLKMASWVQKMPNVVIYLALFIGFMAVVILAPSGIPGFIYANF